MLLLIPIIGITQTRNTLENERAAIIKKIEQTDKILKLTNKKSNNTLHKLNLLDNKIKERRSLIDITNSELSFSEKEEKKLSISKDSLSGVLLRTKQKYNSLLQIQYRNKLLDNKWLYIFSAKKISDIILRYRYYEQYKSYFQKQIELLQYQTIDYRSEIENIKEEKEKKKLLLQSQEDNYKQLEVQKKEKNNLLTNLKKEKKKFKRQLNKAKRKREELNKAIEIVILENLKKKKKKKKSNKKGIHKSKSQLPWPIDNGVVVSNFGIQRHAELKSIEVSNNGIDISSGKKSIVKAVYEGTIIAVIDAQNNGTMVIIQHDDYYTVYSNLVKTKVKNGQEIKQFQNIGSIGQVGILHFELWNNKTKLDPESWLIKN